MATEVRRSPRGHIPRKDGIVFTINDFIDDDDDEVNDKDFSAHEDASDSETPEERAERLAEEEKLENADDSSLDSDDGLETAPKKRKISSDAPKAETKTQSAATADTAAALKKASENINNMFGVVPGSAAKKKKSSSSSVFVNGPGTTVLHQANGIVYKKQINTF
jgi:hypothetical protein